ncbi:Methionyl-tRNA formyltransferase [Alteracholeplasma palmae J233]|uniref:Methionyl-tRNA formyltransferase n=1 Tax=Alteracholeplasma palmae (strain ATCC 49389 / J233) TaxID=1318466 RepID=U4KK56_ALTPJ|nr:methionyl-tRNA formyltransferase [Alteracholeplasma palmae]CCV64034.1 Methionyl-tRNA formyltransferase [Alteracholeplasma palmae J233]
MIVFMGTPEFSVPILKMLLDKKYPVGLVVTQPDKKVGRKQVVTPSPVKQLAESYGVKVYQPEKLSKEYQYILDLKPELIITAAYGQILPKALLEEVPAINIHGSLLPKYRGGAPIQYALFEAEEKTGVTLMEMVYKMDAGDMIEKKEVLISESDNYQTLSQKLSTIGKELLEENIDKILKKQYKKEKQDEALVTFAYTIKKEEEKIDWNKETKFVLGHIKGLSPQTGAYTEIKNEKLKIYNAQKSDIILDEMPGTILIQDKKILVATKNGTVEILEIQQQGRKILTTKVFLNGQSLIKTGDKFQ